MRTGQGAVAEVDHQRKLAYTARRGDVVGAVKHVPKRFDNLRSQRAAGRIRRSRARKLHTDERSDASCARVGGQIHYVRAMRAAARESRMPLRVEVQIAVRAVELLFVNQR